VQAAEAIGIIPQIIKKQWNGTGLWRIGFEIKLGKGRLTPGETANPHG